MKSKKIVIDLLPNDNKLAGTGYFFIRLLSELLKIDNSNKFELHVSNRIEKVEEFKKYENVKIRYHKIPNSKFIRVLYEQFIFPFTFKADILYSPSVAIPFIFKFSARKYITTIHDLIPFIFKKYGFFQQQYVKFITKVCASRADLIVTVSDNSSRDIRSILDIPESKIIKISNFLPSEFDSGSVNSVKEKFFITVSTVQPGKNLVRLIQAFRLFSNQHSDFKLYIVGDLGWQYSDILNLINSSDLKDKVYLKGYVNEFELYRLYRNASALLYVSLYEGFGIPPLEAMNLGCPLVVSNTSSLPEVVGDAGIYVDPYSIDDILSGIHKVLHVNFQEYLLKAKKQSMKFDGSKEAIKFLALINA